MRGKVTDKRVEGEERLVDIEFIGENQRKEMTTKGTATVQLPTKQIPEWAKPVK